VNLLIDAVLGSVHMYIHTNLHNKHVVFGFICTSTRVIWVHKSFSSTNEKKKHMNKQISFHYNHCQRQRSTFSPSMGMYIIKRFGLVIRNQAIVNCLVLKFSISEFIKPWNRIRFGFMLNVYNTLRTSDCWIDGWLVVGRGLYPLSNDMTVDCVCLQNTYFF
jgi:hypothetical protein